MPPGAHNLGDNRFATLASSPKRKKKRPIKFDDFPDLPDLNKTISTPKYIVVSSTNYQKPLSHYSCFAVQKSLNVLSKNIEKISELRDGNLLLLVKDKHTAEKFIAAKQLPGICDITCKYHDNLNFVKGTVFAPFLKLLPDEEIVKELSTEGVVSCFKFTRIVDNKATPSGVILLTFDAFRIPETINISWYKVKVREYFPNPMRCKSCQYLGHTKKHCNNAPLCQVCSLPPHPDLECSRIRCANCHEEHPSSYNKCPKFLQQKEILKIKTQRKCTLKQAREFYSSQLPSTSAHFSFAGVTSSNKIIQPVTETNTSKNVLLLQQEHTTSSSSKNIVKPANTNDQTNYNSSSLSLQSSQSSNVDQSSTSINLTASSSNTTSNSPTFSPSPSKSSNISQPSTSINITTTSSNTMQSQPISKSTISSPITRLTQELLNQNRYFSSTRMTSDSESERSDRFSNSIDDL